MVKSTFAEISYKLFNLFSYTLPASRQELRHHVPAAYGKPASHTFYWLGIKLLQMQEHIENVSPLYQ